MSGKFKELLLKIQGLKIAIYEKELAEQKAELEYTQEQISQAERRGIEFPTDVKEQLFEYANLIGEEEKVRTLVRNLADAVIQADDEGVEDLLDDAQMDIQDLPDPTIGKL